MCHPVCMADESGLGLVMLRSWEMFLEVSTRPMQAPGVPAEHRSPAGSHSFCSKGTRIMLVTKVVFLVLSKCGADRSLCFHSPCPDVLQDLCTEIPSALEEKGDVNTWTAAFGSQPSGTMVQRGLQGNRTFCSNQSIWWSIPAAVASSADLRVLICYHVLSPGVLQNRQVWKITETCYKTAEEKCYQEPLNKMQFYFCKFYCCGWNAPGD